MRRRLGTIVLAVVLAAGGLVAGSTPAQAKGEAPPTTGVAALPIVYVHGGAGSAAQYRSQQMRFASNGYPSVVRAIDRPSGVEFNALFDDYLDDLMAETGAPQVHVVGHSQGTFIMNGYLTSSPERAARVAKYISVDGAPATCAAIATECTNITAAGLGAHGHTQAVTSPESFTRQYEFLTGHSPATTEIVPEAAPKISGRVISFPDNNGPGAGSVTMWEVDARTGHRTGPTPFATFAFDASDDGPDQDAGRWGPVRVDPTQHYEFEVRRDISPGRATHHYMQPFLRSQDTIRLLTAPPDAPTVVNTETGDGHAALVAIRYKEWWGNTSDGTNDSLRISTTGLAGPADPSFPRQQQPVELINAATAPAPGVGGILNNKIGIHVHDVGSDGVTNVDEPIPFFAGITFQTGVDVYMPASSPPDGTIHLVSEHRGDADRPQVLNLANWSSTTDRIVVELDDYVAAEPVLPIVFVHGASGSAAQYQSQAQRFASNGYPTVVTGIDRTSAAPSVISPILDEFLDGVMAETGASQVYVVGHSQGVSVMNSYLNSSPDRAARVAKYIGIDSGSGISREVCPGNVPCKGIWGQGDPTRALGPYNNVQFPDQGHVEAVVSPESFVEQYRFFTGEDPATTDVLPEESPEISGRLVDFPANTAPAEATVRVWPVDPGTGHRSADEPHATFDLTAADDGYWGPIPVDPAQTYELEISRPGTPITGHFYREPFIRSNHLVRLLISPSFVTDNTEVGPDHSSLVAIRYKEWWADHPSVPADSLRIGTSRPGGGAAPVEVITPAIAPVSKGANGIHLFDAGSDGATDLSAPVPFFFALPFQTGADLHMPASSPPDGTISVRSLPRDVAGKVQAVNVPNWPSSTDRMAVELNDYATVDHVPEPTVRRPVVFVHGGAGSGAQFESQAMRFASNGYPSGHVRVLEYNSANPATFGTIPARLDALIADLKAETGADQIDLLGHSLGTGLMQSYLASPARAENVAHYVNIDGSQASAPPGGVSTLALWGRGSPSRRIVGARNTYLQDQAHVQVATSRESFGAMFRFFNDGEEPATLEVVPDPSGEAEISGRAVYFPANDGADGTTLDVYEVDPATGERLGSPLATYLLGPDGSWGPFTGEVGSSFEMAITNDEGSTHHFYTEPLIRDDDLVRLNTSLPDQGLGALVERGPDHSSIVVTRYKEWWGDHPDQDDTLEIDGVNVLNGATAPVSKNAIGVFAYDVGSDGVSHVDAPIAALFGLPFLTGVDHHIAAATPTDRTVTVASTPRGDAAHRQVVNVPNWASEDDPISVMFHDFADPSSEVTYTARYSAQVCATLGVVASAAGVSLSDALRFSVAGFAALGQAIESPSWDPPPNEGPCEVVVRWPADQADDVEEAAEIWGISPDELHHGAGRLLLAIVYALAVG